VEGQLLVAISSRMNKPPSLGEDSFPGRGKAWPIGRKPCFDRAEPSILFDGESCFNGRFLDGMGVREMELLSWSNPFPKKDLTAFPFFDLKGKDRLKSAKKESGEKKDKP